VPTSLISWAINDIPIFPIPFRAVYNRRRFPMVSAGFFSAWKSIEGPLRTLMRNATKFCPSCDRVIITGHSLGAAVGSFAALYASEAMGIPRENIQLITSGGPRTGNRDFAKEVQDAVGETYRIVYGGDIVTKLPTRPIYEHFPTEILVMDGKQKVCSSTNGEDSTCSNALFLQPWRFANIDHLTFNGIISPAMYLKMFSTEPATRWCGLSPNSAPGIGLILAVGDNEQSIDDMAIQELPQAQVQSPNPNALSPGGEVAVGIAIFVGVLAVFAMGFTIFALVKM